MNDTEREVLTQEAIAKIVDTFGIQPASIGVPYGWENQGFTLVVRGKATLLHFACHETVEGLSYAISLLFQDDLFDIIHAQAKTLDEAILLFKQKLANALGTTSEGKLCLMTQNERF